jgi:hypothetical protein
MCKWRWDLRKMAPWCGDRRRVTSKGTLRVGLSRSGIPCHCEGVLIDSNAEFAFGVGEGLNREL